ncbi:MAG TPA: DUF4350 domain-containing protein [Steroidobacteraceae bacterium]|nr:DUF4350 domain-containing protein [Steroidobacteraceae bacterium]
MRDRLTTLGCALGALFLFGTLLFRGDMLAARRAARPTSIERADNGQLGAASWLRGEGVRTLSLRERFDALPRHRELAASGNLLIVSLPAETNFRTEELRALDGWIRAGNTLLVLAALRDRPGWAQFPSVMSNDLQLLTELHMSPGVEPSAASSAQPRPPAPVAGHRALRERGADRQQHSAGEPARLVQLTAELTTPALSTLLPNRPHPYFTAVARAVAFSDYAPLRNNVALPHDGFALSLAHEGGGREDAFWIRALGSGTIIVSGFGSLFSNRALGRADNARLLANVVGANVAADGTVVFDDEHQGLTDAYDPARFLRDRRLYATLAVIAAVWFTWVLGGTQLHMPLRRAAAPREVELVRTTGLFLARVLRPPAAARRMFEQFLARVSRAAGRSAADPGAIWDWLENHPRLTRAEVRQLRAWQAAARANRRVPLLRLHNLMVRAERQLAR